MSIVQEKSIAFAKRIIKLYRYLTPKNIRVISEQILKSGTSIGANIAEAECAYSRKDFLAKMYISFKECVETLYWLELLYSENYIAENEYISLKNDCEELRKILSSITKTTSKTKKEQEKG